MRHFCTYFDSNYLLRGMTLYRSLTKIGEAFCLHVLALDDDAVLTLTGLGLDNLKVISLQDLERWDPRLLAAKANRGIVEYYFTLSPGLPLYLLRGDSSVRQITYLDADLYFFASPDPIFDELGTASILITEHRYPERLKDHERYGRFNVQYQSFRNDEVGLRCLERWHEQCLAWCYDRVEPNRYADQKYLEEWPVLYGPNLVVSRNVAAGVAPWNWSTSELTLTDNVLSAAGRPVIFYHYHGVKVFNRFFISNGLLDWGLPPWRIQRYLYGGYVREMRETQAWLTTLGCEAPRLHDKIKRGKGICIDTLPEVARKAWAQAMFIF